MKRNFSTGRKGVLGAVLVLATALFLPTGGWAERPTDPGGGPPGGHGRHPSDPGGHIKGDLLGDLWVVVRNVGAGGNGEPIHFTWNWPQEYYDETGALVIPEGGLPEPDNQGNYYNEGVEGGCVQPISYVPLVPAPTADGTQFTYDYVSSYGNPLTVYLIPLDAECNIPDVYAETWGTQVTEVDSGRLALARTTQYVIDSAYEEALVALNDATSVTLGPAGRLQIVPSDAPERIIDSPRENLALYQRLMLDGCLAPTANVSLTNTGIFQNAGLGFLVCPESGTTTPGNQDLQVAASFLAGAADKTGAIGIDEVAYLNSILGINTVEESATDGSLFVTGYFNFGDFAYWRNGIYGQKVADLLQPPAGWTEDQGYPASFRVVSGVSISSGVFGGADWVEPNNNPTYPHMPIINFVRAADDAVSVIFYIHNYELPVYPVPLEAEETYDTNSLNEMQQRNALPLQ